MAVFGKFCLLGPSVHFKVVSIKSKLSQDPIRVRWSDTLGSNQEYQLLSAMALSLLKEGWVFLASSSKNESRLRLIHVPLKYL